MAVLVGLDVENGIVRKQTLTPLLQGGGGEPKNPPTPPKLKYIIYTNYKIHCLTYREVNLTSTHYVIQECVNFGYLREKEICLIFGLSIQNAKL